MTALVERIAWLVLAGIHAIPAAAFFRPTMLTSLYGVQRGSDTFLLLQHRAALFAMVVVACLWALAAPGAARLAVTITALSMLSFLVLYLAAGSPGALRPIAIADAIGLPFLFFLAWRAFAQPTP